MNDWRIVGALGLVCAGLMLILIGQMLYAVLPPLGFWPVAVVLGGFVLFVVLNSVYVLGTDDQIAFFLFGSHRWTTVTGDHWEQFAQIFVEINVCTGRPLVRTGIFGLDVEVGLWPFWLGVRLPTSTLNIPIHASAMYTHMDVPGMEDIPRIRLRGDATLQVRLSPRLGKLARSISLLSSGTRDLAQTTELVDILGDGTPHHHRLPLIANLLHDMVNNPTLQSMRTAASFFTWGGRNDIVDNRARFEEKVQEVMTQPGSIFVESGMLRRQLNETGREVKLTKPLPSVPVFAVEPGDSLLSFDVVVELLRPEPTPMDASELEKSIDYAFIGLQEGARERAKERLRRLGQAEGIEVLAKKLGVKKDKIQLFLLEAIRDGNINLFMVGSSPQSIIETLEAYILQRMSGRAVPGSGAGGGASPGGGTGGTTP